MVRVDCYLLSLFLGASVAGHIAMARDVGDGEWGLVAVREYSQHSRVMVTEQRSRKFSRKNTHATIEEHRRRLARQSRG